MKLVEVRFMDFSFNVEVTVLKKSIILLVQVYIVGAPLMISGFTSRTGEFVTDLLLEHTSARNVFACVWKISFLLVFFSGSEVLKCCTNKPSRLATVLLARNIPTGWLCYSKGSTFILFVFEVWVLLNAFGWTEEGQGNSKCYKSWQIM